MIARELDSPVADLRHGSDCARKVVLALVAHGVELQADRNLLAGGSLGQGCGAEAEGDAGCADGTQEFATGDYGG